MLDILQLTTPPQYVMQYNSYIFIT